MVALNHVNDFLRWSGSQEAYHEQLTNLFLNGHVSSVVMHSLTFPSGYLFEYFSAPYAGNECQSRAARAALSAG